MAKLITPSITNCAYKDKYKKIFWQHMMFREPWMLIKLIFGLFYNLYLCLFHLHDPSDVDIITYIENTVLALEVRKHADGKYTCKVGNCLLETQDGVKIGSFELEYEKYPEPKIMSFVKNGRTTSNKAHMMEVMFFYHTASLHTKAHLYSNSLTEYLVDNKIGLGLGFLEPSTRTSIPLHNSLIYTNISPIHTKESRESATFRWFSKIYSVAVTRESIIEESLTNPTKLGDLQRATEGKLKFAQYLSECYTAVQEAIDHQNISTEITDGMYYHMIVHAIDHVSCYAQTWDLKFGISLEERTATFQEIFSSSLFRYLFTKPSLQPLWTNKLKNYKGCLFYTGVYNAVCELDTKYGYSYANELTCSIMF